MGDQPLVAPNDPGQVADTSRLARVEGERDGEPGRIAERLRPRGPQLQLLVGSKLLADSLGLRQIEAEQVASVGIPGDRWMIRTYV
jgi:hypothetical protein